MHNQCGQSGWSKYTKDAEKEIMESSNDKEVDFITISHTETVQCRQNTPDIRTYMHVHVFNILPSRDHIMHKHSLLLKLTVCEVQVQCTMTGHIIEIITTAALYVARYTACTRWRTFEGFKDLLRLVHIHL